MGEDDEFNFGSVEYEIFFKYLRGIIRELGKYIGMLFRYEVLVKI